MKFHVIGLPHTKTTKEFNACAYTMKIYNFCKMMLSLGHEVIHYGAEGSSPPCTENVVIITDKQQNDLFGKIDPKKILYSVDYNNQKPHWQLLNNNAIKEINKRKTPKDFICLICGHATAPISNAIPDLMSVEYGIGYTGTYAKYKVFESYNHMSRCAGSTPDPDGNNYHVVIPNYYDIDDFPYQEEREDYYLFVGRMIKRKGLAIAVETCKQLGKKLVVAGQGAVKWGKGYLETPEEKFYYSGIEYIGSINIEQRAKIMGKSQALFVPTQYFGPLEGVNCEQQLLGNPVICSDWGCFCETVQNGKTGYRCRTLDHYIYATNNVAQLDRQYIRERAIDLWSLDRVKLMYQEYFSMLWNLWESGWYTLNPNRKDLSWLK